TPPRKLEARGEVFFPRRAFVKLNEAREVAGEKCFANPRNAAAGTLKLLDPREVSARPLSLFTYLIAGEPPAGLTTQFDVLAHLRALGLPVNPHAWRARDIEEAMAIFRDWDARRVDLDYETDGMVLKVDSLAWQRQLGATSKAPRWGIAYKFASERAATRIVKINVQVGRTGALTPVAELEPVHLLGTVIKRATLHNADVIAQLDVRVGDVVTIEKGGEIIPKVTGVLKARRTGREIAFQFPQHCPVCGQPLEQEQDEVAIRCVNEHCPAQLKRRILHFASRGAMDIEGLGKALVDQLVDHGIIKSLSDLYRLKPQELEKLVQMRQKPRAPKGQLIAVRMRAKSIGNLLKAIEASKARPLECLVFALGIRHVGAGAARLLARAYPSIDALCQAGEEDLAELEEIGPVLASSIRRYFRQPQTRRLLEKLDRAGVSLAGAKGHAAPLALGGAGGPGTGTTLKGLTFVLTGTLAGMTREAARALIESEGGRVTSSVSRKTSYVVAGSDPGSKIQKASNLAVPILDETGLRSLIKQRSPRGS
ncbi:MAG: NAD-dependent DNA ligase LigA, partial [Candidatus Eisenbacteria sp.]|nr:NAD-dependent DNA ligase LigA [Candidatus Eisenbacteria bacterium]